MIDSIPHPHNDFLTPNPEQVTSPPDDFTNINRSLKAILAELRKSVPKQRCVILPQGGTIVNARVTVGNASPPAIVTFENEGNPVKSFYTIIVNGTTNRRVSVSINEPNLFIPASIAGNGMIIPATGASSIPFLVIPSVEIQYLGINCSGTDAIPIQSIDLTAAIGAIWIYAWTLPEFANITE